MCFDTVLKKLSNIPFTIRQNQFSFQESKGFSKYGIW